MSYPRLFAPAFLALLSFTVAHAASATTSDLMRQGRWQDAANQAARENDFLTAATAMHRLQECPSPAQPKGQAWDQKVADQGIEYGRKAVAQNPKGQDAIDALIELSSSLGFQAAVPPSLSNYPVILRSAKEAGTTLHAAVSLNSSDLLATSTYAFWHTRAAARGGSFVGASTTQGKYWIARATNVFNQTPDATPAQQLRKALGALRIAEAYESLNDKRLLPYFEAAIKLGEQAGGAEGRCVTNVARVHLKRPITDF